MIRAIPAVAALVVAGAWAADEPRDWPQWRGANRDDVSRETGLLKKWPKGGPKKLWHYDGAGIGFAGFAIADGRLFTMGARGDEELLIALDAESGKELWRRVAAEQVPVEGHHRDNDYASSSPTTDGERLYCWFGSAGFHCYSLDGEFVWKRDFGPAKTRLSFGEARKSAVLLSREV